MAEPPKRIQRRRATGWRMPAGAVYVGRPTIWGNPWRAFSQSEARHAVEQYRKWLAGERVGAMKPAPTELLASISELRGRDLCCWCPLGQPCHADVLLEIANNPGQSDPLAGADG